MRGCTSLLAEEVPISGSIHCCIEVLVACDGLALASCQAPRQPLSALLNCTGGETTIKKLMGRDKERGDHKANASFTAFSSDTLCQQNDFSVMRARKQMKKMIAHYSPRGSQTIGIVEN